MKGKICASLKQYYNHATESESFAHYFSSLTNIFLSNFHPSKAYITEIF